MLLYTSRDGGEMMPMPDSPLSWSIIGTNEKDHTLVCADFIAALEQGNPGVTVCDGEDERRDYRSLL